MGRLCAVNTKYRCRKWRKTKPYQKEEEKNETTRIRTHAHTDCWNGPRNYVVYSYSNHIFQQNATPKITEQNLTVYKRGHKCLSKNKMNEWKKERTEITVWKKRTYNTSRTNIHTYTHIDIRITKYHKCTKEKSIRSTKIEMKTNNKFGFFMQKW